MGIIYKLTSPSGKSYVGQTVQALAKRIGNHRCQSRCHAIGAAIRKYGIDSFKVEVLIDNVPTNDLDEVEDHFIVEHNTLKPNGYNLVRGRPEDGKAARYERFKVIAKKFANTESFRQKKRDLWKDDEWRAAWRETWMRKRAKKLDSLEGKERMKKRHEHVRADRTIARRQAKKDPDAWKKWTEEHSKEAGMRTKNVNLFKKRIKTMESMDQIDAHEYLSKSARSAVKHARKTSANRTFEDVQKWYPNVLTEEEIKALRANGGVWPA